MRLSRLIPCLALACVCAAPLYAQTAPRPAVSPAKEKEIRQLLQVVGTATLMQQVMDNMLTTLQKTEPDVPSEVWTKLKTRLNPEAAITQIIPIYDKYYTQEDIAGLLAFYQSPLGKKVIATLPQVNQECLRVGSQWGREQAEAVFGEMEKQHKAAKEKSTIQ